jgi:hypothetical protein
VTIVGGASASTRRVFVACALSLLSLAVVPAALAHAAVPDDEQPVPTPIPQGCPLPPAATAVFVGEVTATDPRIARFRVVQLRAGSLEGYQSGALVDVEYGDEVRFLDVGESYLVGVDDDSGRLVSNVREPAPLFGGNQIAGLDDAQIDCPPIENPIRTLMPDGTPVESGVVAPLLGKPRDLIAAIVLPAVWVFLGLVVVAAVKNLLWASGRELRLLTRRRG